MELRIKTIEVQRTEKTKDTESIYSAIANLSTPYGPVQTIFLFTQSGLFLLKQGRPLVKFRDFDKPCDHTYNPGQTNYQGRLYNRIIERLGIIKTQVTAYLLKNGFIDASDLRKRDPRLYRAAKHDQALPF